jgi:hypothetical protein
MTRVLMMDRICAALSGYTYRFNSETALHAGMALALASEGLVYEREKVAGPGDRFDFLVQGDIVVEAKIKGALPEALAQCLRYAERDDVRGVILASTRFWASSPVPAELAGKPFALIKLQPKVF